MILIHTAQVNNWIPYQAPDDETVLSYLHNAYCILLTPTWGHA